MALLLVWSICLACVILVVDSQRIILQERANGSAAVLLAVNEILQSGVFGGDNDLLRRIAYVETRDGTLPDTFREGYNGGIWAVDEDAFISTKDITTFTRLPAKLQQIEDSLRINWFNVEWRELRKPLYSALAARLVIFNAPVAVPPASDIVGQAQFWAQHYNRGGDISNFATASSGLEGSILESSANEFYVGFSINHDGIGTILRLFITTAETNPVRFSVTANGFIFNGVATSNSSTVVELPNTLEVISGEERNKGIYVKAEGESKIVVYGLSSDVSTTDAYLALPCSNLAVDEYEYFSMTYPDTGDILMVGCEDNTVVTTPSGNFALNRLETYLISDSVVGSRVTSTKPISFFSNQACTNVPVQHGSCDHLTEQIPPTSTWGNSFFVASLQGRNSGELIRMIAARGSTGVTVNCTTYSQVELYNLNGTGSWVEFTIRPFSFCNIESTAPVLIMQFAQGFALDNVGDPFMMMIPPVQQYSNNYVLNVLPQFSTNFITIYVTAQHYQPARIFVDNTSQENSVWVTVYCSNQIICGYITRVPLTAGEHSLFHQTDSGRVGVSAYGFNRADSYGYPGGLKLAPVQLAVVSFSAASYRVLEGAGIVGVTITRSGNTTYLAIVLVATDNFEGTASVKEDYTSVSRIVEFLPGETQKQIMVAINNDKRIERNESFELYLTAGAEVHLSPLPRTEIIIENDDGSINLDPSYGSILGGSSVIITGDRLTVSEEDVIECTFDEIQTRGVYISQDKVLCISPMLGRTGRVEFRLQITGNPRNLFSGESTFTSLSYMNSYDVYVANDDLVFSEGTMIKVRWSPVSIFPMELPDTYSVDIDLLEMNMATEAWNKLTSLVSDAPNTGIANIVMPSIEEVDTVEESLSPVVVRVSISNITLSLESKKRNTMTGIFRRLGQFALKIVRNSPVRYVKKLARQAVQRGLCELWSAVEPDSTGQAILDRLPPCPRRIRDIDRNSGFTEERLSSLSPVIGEIQTELGNLDLPVIGRVGDHIGYTVIDNLYRGFFHPGTTNCFRQRVTPSIQALTGGSGQQCCYNGDNLVTGPPGGGTVDKVSPDVSLIGHFVNDVIPYLLCCKAGVFSSCNRYYDHRPSDNGIDYSPPPPPAIFRGDPHMITLDGHQYTFNGNGEFVLVSTSDDSFHLQGRMVPIVDNLGNSTQGTVFTALVSRQNDSDTVQFDVIDDGIVVLVNGEQVDFSFIKEQEFSNVVVNDLGSSSFSASFSSGAYLKVREENSLFSMLIFSLPLTFHNSETRGLLGYFNGNTSDDLLPNFSQDPLSLNSSLENIHQLFGITWIIDTPSNSLFTYLPGENWATYHDPFFVPIYSPIFLDEDLEHQAIDLCGSDQQCLFDVAATGQLNVGLSTLVSGQEFEEILQLQIPVVCSTPCEFGACIANDTCYCSSGYEGRYCTEIVLTECEENPCENGGSCVRHVLDYTCTCPPSHSGDFCETEVDPGGISTVGIAVGVAGGGILILLLIIIISVVVAIKMMKKHKSSEQTFYIKEQESVKIPN